MSSPQLHGLIIRSGSSCGVDVAKLSSMNENILEQGMNWTLSFLFASLLGGYQSLWSKKLINAMSQESLGSLVHLIVSDKEFS